MEVLASGPQQSRQRRLTRMLLFVSFAWLVLSAPFALHSLATNFISDDEDDARAADRNLLAKIICFLLVYTNHAINFRLTTMSSRGGRTSRLHGIIGVIINVCVHLLAVGQRRSVTSSADVCLPRHQLLPVLSHRKPWH